jgi:DNA-directed RNA polymerase subunit RPC12/RpoP
MGKKTNYMLKYKHPLQPDIDLLYGNIVDGKRQTPLTGVEVKLFSRYTGQLRGLIPKTTSYEGYYAGLDEAISLLSMGLEFVYLWHIKAHPIEKFVKSMKYGDNFWKEVAHKSYHLAKQGSEVIADIIKALDLPIGYISSYLTFVEEGLIVLEMDKRFEVEAQLNPMKWQEKLPVRDLLLQGLDIEELDIEEQWTYCVICKKAFPSKDEAYYCSKCGSKLVSGVVPRFMDSRQRKKDNLAD